MAPLVFVNTVSKKALAGLAGSALPEVTGKLQAFFTCGFAFHDGSGDDPAALDAPAFRFGIKLVPTGAAFAYSSAVNLDETGDFPFYVVNIASLDAAALRTAIADRAELVCIGEIEWTVGGKPYRASFPITIYNAVLRSGDGAPDPEESAADTFVALRAVCYDRPQTLTNAQQVQGRENLGLTLVNGAFRFVLPDGGVAHWPVNTGEPLPP